MSDSSDFAAAKTAKGPTGEQRSSTVPELSGQPTGLPSWSHFMPAEREQAEAWIGRQRTETVQSMLNDSQVTSLRQAIRLPVHRYVIELDPMDADPVATDLLAADLDVPLLDAPDERRPGRRANRFSSRRQLDRALDALDYGHAVFEQAGRIDQAGYWRLTDLAPVPQWTIDDANSWEIDRHGRLLKVVQWHCNPPVELPVDHLVTFTWQGAPGDPRGRSMLRPLYGSWLLRDRTMRVMGMSAERTGMGIPVGKVGRGAPLGAKEAMERLLSGVAAGEDTNLVFETDEPIRDSLMLMGVTGATPDLVGMLRYYDESMARAMLAMLLQLGQTQTGSRALGGTFDDLLAMFHDTVADWFCDVMTQQLVEPWIDRNRGEDAPAPRLVWKRRDEEASTAPASYQYDLEYGTITVDDRRAQLGLPPLPDGAGEGRAVPSDELRLQAQETRQGLPPVSASRREGGVRSARQLRAGRPSPTSAVPRATAFTLPDRPLRREPFAHEQFADFAAMESQHVAARDDLAAVLLAGRDHLVSTAVDLIAAMPTVDPLTLGATLGPQLEAHAAAMDTGPLVALLTTAAGSGVAQVVGEAARQGVALTATVDYEARAEAEARELLRRMAVQVTETAAAAARVAVPAQAARRGLLGRLRPARLASVEADTIATALADLSPAQAEQAAAGATSRATGTGRYAAMGEAPVQRCYGSSLLDEAVCGPCLEDDGRAFPTVEAAQEVYPYGANRSCEGWERCRCAVVAVMSDETPAAA